MRNTGQYGGGMGYMGCGDRVGNRSQCGWCTWDEGEEVGNGLQCGQGMAYMG